MYVSQGQYVLYTLYDIVLLHFLLVFACLTLTLSSKNRKIKNKNKNEKENEEKLSLLLSILIYTPTFIIITSINHTCYESRLKGLSQETTLVLSNTRELDRVSSTE